LAVIASQSAAGQKSTVKREPQSMVMERVCAFEFWSNGMRFYAVVVADEREMREIGVFRAIFGVRRIQQAAKMVFFEPV
jgi:hypothetical protein